MSKGKWGTHLTGDGGAGEEDVLVDEEEARRRRCRRASCERREPHPPHVPHPRTLTSLSSPPLCSLETETTGTQPTISKCALSINGLL
jgi:hypothetical protein